MGAVLDKLRDEGVMELQHVEGDKGAAYLATPVERTLSQGFPTLTKDELLALAKEIEELAHGLG